ncbi:F0F1 ATP synthase subunit B [Sphingorhabdus arenilitoris]|uniref:ATP synthase subunit b n=1 Tax=Sphingorhabdus arenilitoris TaxID=1490041 RepID=A0ABV8RG14_9SPHN
MADFIQMAALVAVSASTDAAATDPHSAENHAATEAAGHGGTEAHVSPSALGFDASMLVALAMVVVIGIALWAKVPAMIAAALDKQIDGIKEQLDAATKLRAEAEAIKAEYVAKSKQAAYDAEQMKLHAEEEAKQIIANAKNDAAAMIARRTKMAEEKIAAAETAAIAGVRAKAAAVSAAAAEQIIASSADAKADAALIDQAIAALN